MDVIPILTVAGLALAVRALGWVVDRFSKNPDASRTAGNSGGKNRHGSSGEGQNQSRVNAAPAQQRQDFRKAAHALREAEITRLSKGWLSNTETYKALSPQQFESAIAELFRLLGYDVMQTPFSNDGGKDAIARKDGKKFLIECKRYAETRSVGRRDIQIFVAAMQDEKADGGFYISTGTFAKTAKGYAKDHGIQIYDWPRLPRLVNKAYGVPADVSNVNVMCLECGSVFSVPLGDSPTTGVCPSGHSVTSDVVRADLGIISSIDVPYCKLCSSVMRIVEWRGQKFWGCPRYPTCRYSRPMLRHERVQLTMKRNEDQFLAE